MLSDKLKGLYNTQPSTTQLYKYMMKYWVTFHTCILNHIRNRMKWLFQEILSRIRFSMTCLIHHWISSQQSRHRHPRSRNELLQPAIKGTVLHQWMPNIIECVTHPWENGLKMNWETNDKPKAEVEEQRPAHWWAAALEINILNHLPPPTLSSRKPHCGSF